MLEKLKKLQYDARVRLYSGDQMHVVDVAGRRTQLLRGGKGAPLVYLHSVIGESNWLPFHQSLSREFDLIAPAHPGYGLSEGGDGLDDMEDFVFHYLDLFRVLGLDKFHLIGASLGGWIAAEIALRYPEKIDRLILVDAAGLLPENLAANEVLAGSPRALRELMLHQPLSFVGEILFPEAEAPDQIGSIATGPRDTTWDRPLYGPKLISRASRISVPTLVLWGANDALYSPRHAEKLVERIPNVKLQMLENCGHLPMFEQESKFVAAVSRFLKSDETTFANAPA